MSAVVTVEQSDGGWWQVRVTYTGSKPTTLLSVPSREEAEDAARGYVAKYNGWTFEGGKDTR